MSEPDQNDQKTIRRRAWWLLLPVPLIGLIGALLLIAGGGGHNGPTPTAKYPTPAPITFIPPTLIEPTSGPTVETVLDKPVPDLTFAALDGGTIRLRDLAGQIVFLNFWATWCGPCQEEMPELQQLQDTRRADGIQVITVTDPSDGQDEDGIRQFMQRLNLTLPVALSSDAAFYRQFEILQIPMTYIIDRQGIVRWRNIGELTEDDITVYLDRLGER